MTDEQVADVIATAIWNEELTQLPLETLCELARFAYEGDDDVEFVDIEFTNEAGPENHGINSEEEMLGVDV